MEMRTILGQELHRLMAEDDRIVVIDADLARANGTFALRQDYPERAFDVGIAEQNMACVAAGISTHGFIPFITSFAPFASRRICDQVAISIAYSKRPVKIVGSDPGLAAEYNGGTHMGLEDISVLRATPTMVIVEPCDEESLRQCLPQIIAYDGPVYLRLHRKNAKPVHHEGYRFDLNRADILREGSDVTLVAAGTIMVEQAMRAAELLSSCGLQAEILDMHTIKPLDQETLIASVKKTGAIVVAENHSTIGGLSSAIAETLVNRYPMRLHTIGIQDRFCEVGKLPELLVQFGMTDVDIAREAKIAIAEKTERVSA